MARRSVMGRRSNGPRSIKRTARLKGAVGNLGNPSSRLTLGKRRKNL